MSKSINNSHKEITFDRVIRMLHRRVSEKIPNASLKDISVILYIHFALIKSVVTASNFRSVRMKYFASFQVYYNTFFRMMALRYRKYKEGKYSEKEYQEYVDKYATYFKEVKEHKTSKYYDINQEDWERYQDNITKTSNNNLHTDR